MWLSTSVTSKVSCKARFTENYIINLVVGRKSINKPTITLAISVMVIGIDLFSPLFIAIFPTILKESRNESTKFRDGCC
nr:MAG TPA: hypothetical protein [Caudoviricetes sp.]